MRIRQTPPDAAHPGSRRPPRVIAHPAGRLPVRGLNAALALLLLAACSPALHPLYRDYAVNIRGASVEERLRSALEEAGWDLAPRGAGNALGTTPRRLRHWGLYSVVVTVEVVPVGTDYVRLFVHPYRHYVTGNRSKIPFLKGSIRRRVLADLDRALEERGLDAIGTSISRDRARRL